MEDRLSGLIPPLPPEAVIKANLQAIAKSYDLEPAVFKVLPAVPSPALEVEVMLDRIRAARALAAAAEASLLERRARLIRQLAFRYDVTVYPHPRLPHVVVVSESDHATLLELIGMDRSLDALGRGYYLWLGDELSVIVAPDWACSPTRVALARLYALAVVPWARPVVRALTRLLSRHEGNRS